MSEAEISDLEAHLAECDVCGGLIDALDAPSDAITQALATLPSTQDDEPEFQRLERLLLSWPSDQTAPLRIGQRLADPPIGPLPQTLGNYELLSCIGRGAWGAVYRARHRTLDQMVAVKVLDSFRWESAAFLERFLHEARAAGQLNHPNIVRATDAGEDRGLHYLVMEYIYGLDVARLLRQLGRLPAGDACEIVRQAAVALEFAHGRGWIHRDVKPSNLMITPEGTVKLLDLGIAGRRNEERTDRPAAHAPLGTAEYMAPEQWTNFASVDARADVYSLGCTLFRLLTGQAAYEAGPPPSIEPDSNRAAPSVIEHRTDVRRGLDRFVQRMLARRPEERIATAGEVAVSLARYARRADLRKLHAGACKRDWADEMDAPFAAEELPATRRVSRRRLLLGGSVAAAGAALLGPWLWPTRSPRLRVAQWRPLVPVPPMILLAVESADQIHMEMDQRARISVQSNDMLLVYLGRAVAGVFAMRVNLQHEEPSGGAGIFFQYRLTGGLPVLCSYQSIELRPNPDSPATTGRRFATGGRLLWSRCAAVAEAGELVIRREGWAETDVELAEGDAGQQLEVVLGRRGFPEVRFNGRMLKKAAWTLSTEGHRQASLSPDRVDRQYLGRLGLLNADGKTIFRTPKLAYL